ncbi:hypothetical protein ACA910_015774 [Epithemia clementina (nom. ined.)]
MKQKPPSSGGKTKQVSLFDFFGKGKKKIGNAKTPTTTKPKLSTPSSKTGAAKEEISTRAVVVTNQHGKVELEAPAKVATPPAVPPKQQQDQVSASKLINVLDGKQPMAIESSRRTPPSSSNSKRKRTRAALEYSDEESCGNKHDDKQPKANEKDTSQQNVTPHTKKIRVQARSSSERRRAASASSEKRRRRMDLEDTDEEENIGESENDESESEFEAGDEQAGEESELEFDQDEDDQPATTPAKKRKTSPSSRSHQKTTPTMASRSGSKIDSTNSPSAALQKTPQSLGAFSARKITPPSETIRRQNPSIQEAPLNSVSIGTTASSKHTFCEATVVSLTSSTASHQPPKFVKNAVNPMGSHVHNHLKFLHPPRDAQGRAPGDDGYDCRTLRVNKRELEQVMGSNVTSGMQQWWDIKAQYFDAVLLFKTGKFYELFHMDADIGVQVLGLIYMKDHLAHAGFPEKSYGVMADKLMRAGYKVARVEQTETPEMLKERKKLVKGKDSPKVVNREVCSILTLGTRTCGFMEDNRQLEEQPDLISAVGPLLAISEKSLVPTQSDCADGDDDDDNNYDRTLIREFGVTLVDASRGWITLGQFRDDCLCSHLQTLLAAHAPSEILYQGGDTNDKTSRSSKHHQTVKSLIVAYRTNCAAPCRMEVIQEKESFPKSTALDSRIRQALTRPSPVQPWNVHETLQELDRRQKYYFVPGKGKEDTINWPTVLSRAVHKPEANGLALSSFGAALFYLQRNLIDAEILSMRVVKEYTSPTSTFCFSQSQHVKEREELLDEAQGRDSPLDAPTSVGAEEAAMSIEGTTLHNLEIIANADDNKEAGSLWSKLHNTKTPHGARLLRAWLLRPLFRKSDIDRRADAVEELAAGGTAALVSEQARKILAKCGDLERLLSRVHSMSGAGAMSDMTKDGHAPGAHPNERAVLYEEADYTKRKVGDFSKVLNGLKHATKIPLLFQDLELREGGLLAKIVQHPENGGCFPDIASEIDWYFDNFDCDKAAQGQFEPSRGVDTMFDQACDAVEGIKSDLLGYKNEMCQDVLRPSSQARSAWKYINTMPDSKDKYLIELPASIRVPHDWILKGKRGKGAKQVNKYRTPVVEELVMELERAFETIAERRARAVQLIFARFNDERDSWAAAAQATAILDALCAMAQLASQPGYTRPRILDYNEIHASVLSFRQARHPCVEGSLSSPEFIPNDLVLGGSEREENSERVLLLSGPNMGGKSTFLRQTCILAILAQIGSYVPAEECELTPVDRIYTRLGASDRILLGQSTFFVELSETSTALRGATSRSLVIMDELGRGTSTFDGTAIAFAAVKHLVERNKCLALFATHYHNLVDDWSSHPLVRLGHMECMVESNNEGADEDASADGSPSRVTFLYTLGRGACPKSFGINVARLAGLPNDVLVKAGNISNEFERELGATLLRHKVEAAIQSNNWELVRKLWEEAQQ